MSQLSRQPSGEPNIGNGLNTVVEYEGQRYHVQTQFSTRDAPVIESLVFQDGRVLVRITSSHGDVADRLGFTVDDGRHLLELQHADIIHKIRRGMLSGDDAPASSEGPQLRDVEGNVVDPAECDDPSVQQLLRDLGVAIDGTSPPTPATEHREPAQHPPFRISPRRSRFRLVIRIILPF